MSRAKNGKNNYDRLRGDFPERIALILKLALANAEFRAICEEYELAVEALARFSTSGSEAGDDRVIEYRTIVRDLRSEIEANLAKARQ